MSSLNDFNNNFIVVLRRNNEIVYISNEIGKKLSSINLNDTYILLKDRFYVCQKQEYDNDTIEIYYDITDHLNRGYQYKLS